MGSIPYRQPILKDINMAATHSCGDKCKHDSDCALHNEPAYPNQPCDCSLKLLGDSNGRTEI